jgi:CRISPR-associated protein Csx17
VIEKPPKNWKRDNLNADLAAFLRGEPGICLADYNAGCWFGAANKAFNSGTAKPFREGQVSPWAMALACEAFGLFQGSPSRRLGSARRTTGAFPFVTTGAAPTAAGEAGKNLGELWLPIWEQPMSLPEVIALFQRGRAEVNGRGATTPPAFAAAILQRGIDTGIREFRRFLLLRTTSENTFESRLASVISVSGKAELATSDALTRMLEFRERLAPDKKKGKRWIYTGLRGPVDEALVAFAEAPTRPENARNAVDAMVGALRKADRNRRHRAQTPSIQFQQLPGAWARSLLAEDGSDACGEARIGLALATLFAGRNFGKAKKMSVAQLLPYWLGVQQRGIYCSIPEAVPFRRVWGAGGLSANLVAILQRRLIEQEPSAEPPFGAWYSISLGDIETWLSGATHNAEIERWMMRFSLFDWEKESVAAVSARLSHTGSPDVLSGNLVLFALFKPLFQKWLLTALFPEGSKREVAKTGPLPGIAAQLARGNLTAAVQLARTAYRAAGIEPAKLPSPEFTCEDPQRLLAALLIPTQRRGVTDDFTRTIPALCTRWLSPRKQINNP